MSEFLVFDDEDEFVVIESTAEPVVVIQESSDFVLVLTQDAPISTAETTDTGDFLLFDAEPTMTLVDDRDDIDDEFIVLTQIGPQGEQGPPGDPGPVGPEGPPGGTVLSGWWQYNSTATPPPNTGELRTTGAGNPPVGATSTAYLHHTDDDGLVWPGTIAQVGDQLFARDGNGNSWRVNLSSVTETVAGASGYSTLVGQVISTTGTLTKNRRIEINLIRAELTGSNPAFADLSYTFYQSTPSTSWVINHTLAFMPSVTVVDSMGRVIWPGDIEYLTASAIRLTFSASVGGTAYLS